MKKWTLTDADILAQIPEATRRGEESLRNDPRAERASYDRATRSLHVAMTNGTSFTMPIARLPHLGHLSDDELSEVALTPFGYALEWAGANTDVTIEYLAELAFGKPTLMRAAGRAGGRSRSEAKTRAARANGRKGGRPRNTP